MNPLEQAQDAIETIIGTRPSALATPLGGGCINEAYQVDDFFIKTHSSPPTGFFKTEAIGLQALGAHLRTPEVIAVGEHFLVLEFLPLVSTPQEEMGRALANLHQQTVVEFGWEQDNFIGATPQSNLPTPSWPEFFATRRLEPLLHRLPKVRGASKLLSRLDELLSHCPKPSLLHGDLWGGNAAGLSDGTPVLFDPAVYYGDHEADLAMTQLFGGFSEKFRRAYEEIHPLQNGHQARETIYNLYHILNHAVLFGGSYHRQAEAMIAHF